MISQVLSFEPSFTNMILLSLEIIPRSNMEFIFSSSCLAVSGSTAKDNERPYYTDKPDWDAFGAMLLVAACHTYEEPVPPTMEKDWDFGEHPLIARLASDDERVWSLFRGATWWLPLSDSFLFQGPVPTDDQTMIATLGGLRKELEKLNQLAWQADEDTILGWADRHYTIALFSLTLLQMSKDRG